MGSDTTSGAAPTLGVISSRCLGEPCGLYLGDRAHQPFAIRRCQLHPPDLLARVDDEAIMAPLPPVVPRRGHNRRGFGSCDSDTLHREPAACLRVSVRLAQFLRSCGSRDPSLLDRAGLTHCRTARISTHPEEDYADLHANPIARIARRSSRQRHPMA